MLVLVPIRRLFVSSAKGLLLSRTPTSSGPLHRTWTINRTLLTRQCGPEELGLRHVAGPYAGQTVDIVAVHGLAADPSKTWTWRSDHSSTQHDINDGSIEPDLPVKVNWLTDILPGLLPTARILTFNYPSKWLSEAPRDDLRNIATRLLTHLQYSAVQDQQGELKSADSDPANTIVTTKERTPLLFIGHSFGGLVIEAAMVLAAQRESFRSLLTRTHSVIFLGTPHRGTKYAEYGRILGECAAALGLGSSNALIEKLEKGAPDVKEMVSDFAIAAREFDVDLICFYETLPTKLFKTKLLGVSSRSVIIVDKDSASLDGWPAIGLSTTHSGLNKHGSINSANLEPILSKLTEKAKRAPDDIRKRRTKDESQQLVDPIHFVVPHMRNSTFQPRPEVSKKLSSMFQRFNKAHARNDRDHFRVALYGPPGCGKTQRAVNTAFAHQGERHVFWINASSRQTFNETLTTIARVVEPAELDLVNSETDLMYATKKWLESSKSGKWLLIVDGVDSSSEEEFGYMEHFLPHKRGITMFTSATSHIVAAVGFPEFAIEIGPIELSEALKIFRKISGDKDTPDSQIKMLLDHLEYIPLAITQAAAYIRHKHTTVSRYLELIESMDDATKSKMFDASSADPDDYASPVSRSVTTTFAITFQNVERHNPAAMLLLKYMAMLGPNIPYSLLQGIRGRCQALEDELHFVKAVGDLMSYSLIVHSHSNLLPKRTLRVPRLAGVHARIHKPEAAEHSAQVALQVVEAAFPLATSSKKTLDVCRALLQHANAVLLHASAFQSLTTLCAQLQKKIDLFSFYTYDNKVSRLGEGNSKKSSKRS